MKVHGSSNVRKIAKAHIERDFYYHICTYVLAYVTVYMEDLVLE